MKPTIGQYNLGIAAFEWNIMEGILFKWIAMESMIALVCIGDFLELQIL